MIRTKYSIFDYLIISENDKNWGLYVTGSGNADIPPHTPYPPTKHPKGYMFDWQNGRILTEFQILYITRGSGIFESKATGRKKIEEGYIIHLFPGVWHRYMPDPKTGWKEHWISFSGSIPNDLLNNGILSREKAVLEIGLNEKLINLYQEILELIESQKIGYQEIIASLTFQIVANIQAIEKSKKFFGIEFETTINKAKIFMADRIDKNINMEQLASELGVGYSWFRRMFRHYTGLPPVQYFLELKLNKAKELLVNTSLPIKEIAVITGFESQFYFSKFFKNRVGMSPIKYREFSRGK
ncbi:MAG TPA: AraC family transcriptional regulator [Candidatus Marinimicrobia bacterium]|nr:AraC family transcriptional regulator [Candidatus Neomarinimicrobiota bacterium]HRS52899.1 AraC family transcriptional regulator [Candidatus Neomarinimicrobiota bacterium]